MPTETFPAELSEIRTISTTAAGSSLTTTPSFLQIPNGSIWLGMTPKNYTTAVVAQVALSPYLVVFKTTDNLAAVANQTDYSEAAQDGDTATDVVLSSLSTAAANDFMFVGSAVPIRGVSIDVDATNGTASALTVKYRKSDNSWADITATDNTGGATSLANDGTVTWTVPTDWIKTTLNAAYAIDAVAIKSPMYGNTPLYWTRWQWAAGLDSSTTLNSIVALNRSTAYFELETGVTFSQKISKGIDGVGSIEMRTDAGTANIIVRVGAGKAGFV